MAEQIVAIAKVRGLKISPRKVLEVIALVRGKRVSEAEKILRFARKGAAPPVLSALKSASANAKARAGSFDGEGWVIAKIVVDRGPIFSRRLDMKPRLQRGMIEKRSAHLTIEIKKMGEPPLSQGTPLKGGKGKNDGS